MLYYFLKCCRFHLGITVPEINAFTIYTKIKFQFSPIFCLYRSSNKLVNLSVSGKASRISRHHGRRHRYIIYASQNKLYNMFLGTRILFKVEFIYQQKLIYILACVSVNIIFGFKFKVAMFFSIILEEEDIVEARSPKQVQ